MIAAIQPQPSVARKPAARKRYVGEVVYIYAYDAAYEMKREPVFELLGQKVESFTVGAGKRTPRHMFFYKPQMVRLPALERVGPQGPVKVERVVKLLSVGAISISMRVPFQVNRIEELVGYHDLQLNSTPLNDEVRHLAEEIRRELEPD